jgi:rhomboid protease GluP
LNQNIQPKSNNPPPGMPGPAGSAEPPTQSGPGQWVPVKVPEIKPVVVFVLIGITVLVYVLQEASRFFFNGMDLPAGYGLKANDAILAGQLWRLFTPMLLHASLIHIGVNMYSLYALGPALEKYYGHWRFLTLYVLGGFAGNVVSFMFTQGYSVGASTAIFGLVGANRALLGEAAQRGLRNVIAVAAINLIIGLTGGFDNWGHVGGLVGGTAFAWLAGPLMTVQGVYPNFELHDQRESGEILRAGLSVGAVFVLLTAGTIYLRLR